ncbi:MAG: hypothetical protein ACYTGH_10040 [Planctomycetota bacterium]
MPSLRVSPPSRSAWRLWRETNLSNPVIASIPTAPLRVAAMVED